ncbi:beta-ribofuranosylaminobenzene 5'-phosphate synthase family protein [Methylotenera sp.]|uniref:beta-ribofuranosylaminobenzene 5'-phosphate synthase family protein n=1 Tax=Methylotenera sp. TaxID=2051956 RepID=UPI0027311B45|nr:beta-ribofuranosylaminobenzene 5'-phosphate synthase family protein [Methylotenera sp.]MDP2230685.1 GHMP kinase [Methylotenera sp.]MDP3140902.1 GHMP kinase [Methylotenera sp.]
MANVIPTKITVKSTARLHMGFFDLHGGLGRKFGSIGLSLTTPSVELTANPSDKLLVTGLASQHAFDIAQKIITKLSLNGAVNLNVKQCIPQHAGLGSGTQFSLAIGAAISRLYQLNLNVVQIAELTGRGSRSGIGIAAFNSGGLLIDGGRVSSLHSSSENKLQEASLPVLSKVPSLKVPPLLARYDFPEHWRILLIFDASQPGIHGEEELVAFNKLPVFSENLAAHLCRSVLMQAMPALVEHDLNSFGRSIRELQAHVGDYFAPAQGGRYASKKVGAVLQYLEATGVACLGQSSWGPTGFAVFENLAEAEKHLQSLKITFAESNLTWVICSANNHGAEIIQA